MTGLAGWLAGCLANWPAVWLAGDINYNYAVGSSLQVSRKLKAPPIFRLPFLMTSQQALFPNTFISLVQVSALD